MPVGVEMNYVRCIEETTSGRFDWVRRGRRRRGSDEVAVFAAIHDAESGRLLAPYRWSSTGVDSGELKTIRQSMLAPTDSTSSISVTIVGYEIDGRGATSTLVKDKYQEWVGSVSAGDWGMSLENGAVNTAARVLLIPPFVRRVLRDDVIMLDRFRIDEDDVTGGATPDPERFAPSDAIAGLAVDARYERVPGGDLKSARTYTARSENSVYEVGVSFRT